MNFRSQVSASSLYFALVVSLLSALFIAVILFAFTSQKIIQNQKKDLFAVNLAMSNAWQLGSHTTFREQSKIQDSYTYSKKDSTDIQKNSWGAFEYLETKSTIKTIQKIERGLLSQPLFMDSLALFMAQGNSPLALAGNTLLSGSVIVPEQGLKRGAIGGEQFTRAELVDGKIETTTSSLPSVNPQTLTEFSNKLSLIDYQKQTEIGWQAGIDTTHSFSKPTLYFSANQAINITNQKLKGNIVVLSPTTITVEPTAYLEDVILVAKSINILPNTIAKAQLIAKDSISISSGVELQYPSAVVVQSEEYSRIVIENNSLIEGVVVHLNSRNTNSETQIGNQSIIHGQLYSTAPIELKGKIYGSCFAKEFFYNSPSTNYRNYLYNTEINNFKKSPYIQTSVVETNKNVSRKAIKWLY